jgi:hypothetical protein
MEEIGNDSSPILDVLASVLHGLGKLTRIDRVAVGKCLLSLLVGTQQGRVGKYGNGLAHGVLVVGTDEHCRPPPVLGDLEPLMRRASFVDQCREAGSGFGHR